MSNAKGYYRFLQRLKSFGVLNDVSKIALHGYGATLRELFDKHGNSHPASHVIFARGEVMVFLRLRFGWSLPTIGDLFERNHSTILHTIQRYEENKKEIEARRQEAAAMVKSCQTPSTAVSMQSTTLPSSSSSSDESSKEGST